MTSGAVCACLVRAPCGQLGPQQSGRGGWQGHRSRAPAHAQYAAAKVSAGPFFRREALRGRESRGGVWGVEGAGVEVLECGGGCFDIWVCVLLVRALCVGSLSSNNLGEEVQDAIRQSAPAGCSVEL